MAVEFKLSDLDKTLRKLLVKAWNQPRLTSKLLRETAEIRLKMVGKLKSHREYIHNFIFLWYTENIKDEKYCGGTNTDNQATVEIQDNVSNNPLEATRRALIRYAKAAHQHQVFDGLKSSTIEEQISEMTKRFKIVFLFFEIFFNCFLLCIFFIVQLKNI
jgi:hypothetical protein